MNISEIFFSIQGEGIQMGRPTIFVRTKGCNLRCTWCDTKYALEADDDNGCTLSIDEIVARVAQYPSRTVSITGGEPLIQKDLPDLITKLRSKQYDVSIETNGSLPIASLIGLSDPNIMISMDVKCPSSAMEDRMDHTNIPLLRPSDQIKFVIADGRDIKFAFDIIARFRPGCTVIMTPVGEGENTGSGKHTEKDYAELLATLVEHVLSSGQDIRVLPQLHKIIWGARARGV